MILHENTIPVDCSADAGRTGQQSEPELASARGFIFNVAAGAFGIDADLLRSPTRGRRKVAFARQVGMYLAHVACELSLTAVGRVFERDRSTVAYACKRVEEARGRPHVDCSIIILERVVVTLVKASPALRRDLQLIERGGQR